MSSFNKVYLVGNLTRDPESRDLPSGTKLNSFGLAVNRTYRKADGEEVEETTFVDIDAFGRSAENILKYCKKGGRRTTTLSKLGNRFRRQAQQAHRHARDLSVSPQIWWR